MFPKTQRRVNLLFICTVLLAVGVQHLLNWGWRKVFKETDNIVVGVMITLFSMVVSYLIIYHIILWGKNLV